MASVSDWHVPGALQPKLGDYRYDLESALTAVVGVRATIPSEAFTASILGTERGGNGVIIREDGLILTIGYLITEADAVWLTMADGKPVPGHVMAYDQESGFGLIQALERREFPVLPMGDSSLIQVGERVVIGGAGGAKRSVAARVVAKQEFAGNWEYVVDEAIFTAPAHPNWGGTALIGPTGELLGVGSLQLEQARERGPSEHINMVVPIDMLKPIVDDLLQSGRRKGPVRPWLGVYATEIEDKIVLVGITEKGPAQKAGLQTGDIVINVAGTPVDDLATFFRKVWSLGAAGTEIPLTIYREGNTFEERVMSSDRNRLLWKPKMH
jgi:S1-C subfamily serine protease